MTSRQLPFVVEPGARSLAAAVLRTASHALDALAQRLAVADAPGSADSAVVEFHAEAGAPEGALYVNGRLLGRLDGVTRL